MSHPDPTNPTTPADAERTLWKRYVWMLAILQPDKMDAMEFSAIKAQLGRSNDDVHRDRQVINQARFLRRCSDAEKSARAMSDGQPRDKWRQRIDDAAREANLARHELRNLHAAHPGLVGALDVMDGWPVERL